MNVDNFIVRPKRKLVETYAQPEAWEDLDEAARHELAEQVANLPAELDPERFEAKQFDMLMLNLQLCLLKRQAGFVKHKKQAVEIASALEEQANIPIVGAELPLIQDLQTDAWWQDVTVEILEHARRHLRGLVYLIEKRKRVVIYTDFEDDLGDGALVSFQEFGPPDSFEKFKAKVRHFLRQHEDHIAVHKLRTNNQLTSTDLAELERMLHESGTGSAEDFEQAKEAADGLGLFVRSLLGLDRAAAREAFSAFMSGRKLSASQIEFIDMIIEQLTEAGVMDAARLYESPYTDSNPLGVEGIFAAEEADKLFAVLDQVRQRAAA